jgi:hypothetical protein
MTQPLTEMSARNLPQETSVKAGASRALFAWLILRPWRWSRHVPPKRRLIFNRLCGVLSQKIELFIAIVVCLRHVSVHVIRRVCNSAVLTLVHYTQNYWGFGLCSSSGILQTREHSVLRGCHTLLGPLELIRSAGLHRWRSLSVGIKWFHRILNLIHGLGFCWVGLLHKMSTSLSILVSRLRMLYYNFYFKFSCYLPSSKPGLSFFI